MWSIMFCVVAIGALIVEGLDHRQEWVAGKNNAHDEMMLRFVGAGIVGSIILVIIASEHVSWLVSISKN